MLSDSGGATGGCDTVAYPGVQVAQRRPQDEALLAAVHWVRAAEVLERAHLMQVGVCRTATSQVRIRSESGCRAR